jgi:nucleotide-binding universal stress UspA family protein
VSAYRSIVVGTDGSSTATVAVRHAAGLAAAFGARLTVVCAFDPDAAPDRDEGTGVPPDLRWRLTGAAQADEHAAAARSLAQSAGAAEVGTYVAPGDPGDVIVTAAREVAADLIVVGNRGMTGAARFLLGSVPDRVSHHAPCDLMIVRTLGT